MNKFKCNLKPLQKTVKMLFKFKDGENSISLILIINKIAKFHSRFLWKIKQSQRLKKERKEKETQTYMRWIKITTTIFIIMDSIDPRLKIGGEWISKLE